MIPDKEPVPAGGFGIAGQSSERQSISALTKVDNVNGIFHRFFKFAYETHSLLIEVLTQQLFLAGQAKRIGFSNMDIVEC